MRSKSWHSSMWRKWSYMHCARRTCEREQDGKYIIAKQKRIYGNAYLWRSTRILEAKKKKKEERMKLSLARTHIGILVYPNAHMPNVERQSVRRERAHRTSVRTKPKWMGRKVWVRQKWMEKHCRFLEIFVWHRHSLSRRLHFAVSTVRNFPFEFLWSLPPFALQFLWTQTHSVGTVLFHS